MKIKQTLLLGLESISNGLASIGQGIATFSITPPERNKVYKSVEYLEWLESNRYFSSLSAETKKKIRDTHERHEYARKHGLGR